jgi:hypothetical protein
VKRRTMMLASALMGIAPLAFAVPDISGVKVDDEITLANQKLVLNGAGIRSKFTFSVYVCALYLREKRHTTAEVLALPGAKKVMVTMLREISSDDLGDALLSGMRHNSTPEQTSKIGLQLVQLGQLFGSIPRLKKGDTFSLDYVPEIGTTIIVNGKPALDPLPDPAFFDAILRIWLGENPADSSLKPLLLGINKDAPSNSGAGGRSGG